MPIRQTKIAIHRQFQVVSPSLAPHTNPTILTRNIIVKKGINTVHPIILIGAVTDTCIQCIAAVFITRAKLGK